MDEQLSRRQALGILGSVSLGALLAACGDDEGSSSTSAVVTTTDGATATVEPQTTQGAELFGEDSSCTLTPEQTEGPYYLDVDAIRSDIRDDREGVSLRVALRVRDADSCEPTRNAVVDIWHCDASGDYSGVQGQEGRFLRGTQVTNADGVVEFTTVYPGSYPGRTPHIHAKVHLDRTTALTTQLYFEEQVSAEVYAREPYATAGAVSSNASDGIFDERLILDLSKDGDGYLGKLSFDVARS